jgi:hypothetical protein
MTDDHSIDEGRQAILAALERHQVNTRPSAPRHSGMAWSQ